MLEYVNTGICVLMRSDSMKRIDLHLRFCSLALDCVVSMHQLVKIELEASLWCYTSFCYPLVKGGKSHLCNLYSISPMCSSFLPYMEGQIRLIWLSPVEWTGSRDNSVKIWKYDESLGSKVTSPIGEHADIDGHEVDSLFQKLSQFLIRPVTV